jgi:cytochrome c peroxidase
LVAVFVFLAGAVLAKAAPFPPPLAGPANPPSAAKFELGRLLFYDARLSANETQSCASCHQQSRAFTDGRVTAVGSTGQIHHRNTQTLTNAGYNSAYTWSGTKVRSLERQALVPMFNRHPIELGVEKAVMRRIASDPAYKARFAEAFPNQRRRVTIANVARALAIFERRLISSNAPYDEMVYGGRHDALSPAATRGMHLFFSERTRCASCHGGFNFAGPVRHAGAAVPRPLIVNNGVTAGAFRVPTLRNVELTGPYMHDGSMSTLEQVIEQYDAKRKLALSAEEKQELVEFLRSLTDRVFVSDERFSDPWPQIPLRPRESGGEGGRRPDEGAVHDNAPLIRPSGTFSPLSRGEGE